MNLGSTDNCYKSPHENGCTLPQWYLSWARDEPAETPLAPAKHSCAPYKLKKKYQLRKRLSKWNFAIFQFWKKILDGLFISLWAPGPCFNIKTVFPCMVSYVKDKTVPTVLSLSWDPYIWKTASLYWDRPHVLTHNADTPTITHFA